MNILITILILGIIIIIHELGHFMTAKFFKMPVSEFSIGLGPKIYSYEGIETTYSIRSIPIGGFVSIDGMEVDSKVKGGFNSKPPFYRFIVLFAGVFMNFLLAFVIIYITIVSQGKFTQNNEAIIGDVVKSSKAHHLIMPGDKIIKLNNQEINSWQEISEVLAKEHLKNEKIIQIEVLRSGKEMTFDIEPIYDPGKEKPMIGILPEYSVEKYGVVEGIKAAGETFWELFRQIMGGLKMIFTGKVRADEVTGPVGMIKVVEEASQGGFSLLAWLTALLSVNIGIFNLLPFPALDGGRIVFVILELVGVKVDKKLEARFHMAGLVILLGLILLITMNDVFNLMSK